MITEKYPFDFDVLDKGQVIPPEVIESIVKLPRSHNRYGLKMLALKEQIERELEARGRPVVARCEKEAIHILTDEEARPYTDHLYRLAKRGLRRAHRKTNLIDRENLSNEERSRHDRQMLIQGAQLAAMSRASKKLTADPHQRITPVLIGTSQ